MDVATAFIYAELEEVTYVDILEGVKLARGAEIRRRLEGVWEDIPTSNSKHNSEQIALTHSHSLLAHALMYFTHSHSHRRVSKTL